MPYHLARWRRYCEHLYCAPHLGFTLDISQMRFPADYLEREAGSAEKAIQEALAIESGSLANVDEGRMVGHYWLRAPALAPSSSIRNEIEASHAQLRSFIERASRRELAGNQEVFDCIHIGIGGSAVGPQLLCASQPSGSCSGALSIHFLDNADPDGVNDVLGRLHRGIEHCLVSVVSKSGYTPTPNAVAGGLRRLFEQQGLRFGDHAVATTVAGSSLHEFAVADSWLGVLPMWDWVGGRTSVASLVGLLPAALQGIDVESFLDGAAAMDRLTRAPGLRDNPAGLLACMWFWAGSGRGDRNMLVLPYSDRLVLFPRWVQQLVMESVGKRYNRQGVEVEQGLTVFGCKGVSDQHSYMQQILEGRNDCFATLIWAANREPSPVMIDGQTSLNDVLFANMQGTREALSHRNRDSITIGLPDLSPRSIGALVALYERTVDIYAALIGVNAYHQPSVDKFAAKSSLDVMAQAKAVLTPVPQTVDQLVQQLDSEVALDRLFATLTFLAQTQSNRVGMHWGQSPRSTTFFLHSQPG